MRETIRDDDTEDETSSILVLPKTIVIGGAIRTGNYCTGFDCQTVV